MVHTVIGTNYDVREGYDAITELMKKTLSKSHFRNERVFYLTKGNY